MRSSACLRATLSGSLPIVGDSERVGMHFGTFQMTSEGIDEPLRALEDACRARNIPPSRFRTLGSGESVRLTEQENRYVSGVLPTVLLPERI